MALSGCLCSSNARKLYVKIVHPGGRVELYDRSILAAQIMMANPRCCVAFPDVFRQPAAVASPDTLLMLGQKFFVVPKSALRKLQRRSSPSLPLPMRSYGKHHMLLRRSVNDVKREEHSGCFKSLFTRGKTKEGMSFSMDDSFEKGGNASLRRERRGSPRRRRMISSPVTPSCQWQPSLESISEE